MTPVRGIILKHPFWRADREAEGARLLSEYGPQAHLGFESPALRQNFLLVASLQRAFSYQEELFLRLVLHFQLENGILSTCTRRYLSWIEDLTTNQAS